MDHKYGIQKRFDEVVLQMRSTTFVEALTKEMATFFRCKPTLKDVIAARNEYTQRRFLALRERPVRLGEAGRCVGARLVGRVDDAGAQAGSDFKRSLRMKVYDVATAGAYGIIDKDIPSRTS